jgi:hypothetical protein
MLFRPTTSSPGDQSRRIRGRLISPCLQIYPPLLQQLLVPGRREFLDHEMREMGRKVWSANNSKWTKGTKAVVVAAAASEGLHDPTGTEA